MDFPLQDPTCGRERRELASSILHHRKLGQFIFLTFWPNDFPEFVALAFRGRVLQGSASYLPFKSYEVLASLAKNKGDRCSVHSYLVSQLNEA